MKYTHKVTLDFVVVNRRCWLFSAARKRDIKRYISQAQDCFDMAGIKLELGTVCNTSFRDFSFPWLPFMLGDDQHLLYRRFCGTHKKSVTVFLFDKLKQPNRRSSAVYDAMDVEYSGIVNLVGYDMIFGKESRLVLAHELGHLLFNTGHTHDGINIMRDKLSMMDNKLTIEQIEAARRSRFAHKIKQ